MSDITYLVLTVRPAVSPDDRADLFEDPINDLLEKQNLGECVGGGTMLDGSLSDLEFEVKDVERAVEAMRSVLAHYKDQFSFEIVQAEPERRVIEI